MNKDLCSYLTIVLYLVEWAIGVPLASVLKCLGGCWMVWLLKRYCLYLGIALEGMSGIHLDRFAQLNFVDLHIIGATISSLVTLVDAVLFLTVGAACMRAASTVLRVFGQSE